MKKMTAVTGNEALAEALRQINPDVCAAYPITPQTDMMQQFSDFVADGLVEGPAAVAGTVIPTRRGRLLADVIARALTAEVAPGRSTAASR